MRLWMNVSCTLTRSNKGAFAAFYLFNSLHHMYMYTDLPGISGSALSALGGGPSLKRNLGYNDTRDTEHRPSNLYSADIATYTCFAKYFDDSRISDQPCANQMRFSRLKKRMLL